MAGICRPTQCLNSVEYKDIILDNPNLSNDITDLNMLINGNIESSLYQIIMRKDLGFQFEIFNTVNVYAYGKNYYDSGGETLKGPIQLYKLINGKFSIYGSYEVKHNEWYLLFKELPIGRYKIMSSVNYVNFSEWFLELIDYNLLIKENDYYNINDSNYDIIKKNYEKIVQTNNDLKDLYKNNNVNLKDLFIDKNINNEIFKPIDKLIPFKINKLKVK